MHNYLLRTSLFLSCPPDCLGFFPSLFSPFLFPFFPFLSPPLPFWSRARSHPSSEFFLLPPSSLQSTTNSPQPHLLQPLSAECRQLRNVGAATWRFQSHNIFSCVNQMKSSIRQKRISQMSPFPSAPFTIPLPLSNWTHTHFAAICRLAKADGGRVFLS